MNKGLDGSIFTRSDQYASNYSTHVSGGGYKPRSSWIWDYTVVELHGVVPHPTTPGFAATSSYRGTVVTSILVRSGEY